MALRLPPALVAKVIYAIYKPWCATLRVTEDKRERVESLIREGKPVVLCLWHDECFTLIHMRQGLKLMTIASQSRDGAFITGALESLGFAVARGSSSRGGTSALLASARLMRKGYSPAITIDGPRGPRHVVKDGVLFLSRLTNTPLVPIRAFCERSIRFKSWDRFEVPLPFSKVTVRYGEPYWLGDVELDEAALERERRNLEQKLADLESV